MMEIDLAFRQTKRFSISVVIGSVVFCCFVIFKCFSLISNMQAKIYVLTQNGKVLEALASNRSDNIAVEAKDHIETFHFYFFTLSPDDKVIRKGITKALYLADGSAKSVYDDLKENGYYSGVISGNINQTIDVDSVKVDIDKYPYQFRCYATVNIVRPTSIVYRKLITEGQLRNVSKSDNNSHGFLIERWNIIENKDVGVEQRK